MEDSRALAHIKTLISRLDEAANLLELGEAAMNEGNFDAAKELNAQAEVIQKLVNDEISKLSPPTA